MRKNSEGPLSPELLIAPPPPPIHSHAFALPTEPLTDRGVDVGLEDLRLVQLLVPVRRDPDLAQRALLRENDLGVKHACLLRQTGQFASHNRR